MNLFRNKLSVIKQSAQLVRNKYVLAETPKNLVKCGQATPESHPHLLKPGELMPYISLSEFRKRKENLMDLIFENSKFDKKHIIIIPSATKKFMSDRIPYVFRQNSDFLYLSGCMEPDSCLVLHSTGSSFSSTLFVRNPDSHSELWDGPRTSVESAPALFGVDNSLPMSKLSSFLGSVIKESCFVWYEISDHTQPFVDETISQLLQSSSYGNFDSPKCFIHKLRLLKSPAEISLMKQSCNIAAESINKTIAISTPGIMEHQIYAKVDYECRMNGAEYLAYPPVVAGGNRATIIHYINNNQIVSDGELILMDAGCEYHGYSSDITRTWPVNGKFSKEQKLLYEVIQCVQSDLLKKLHSYPSLDQMFDTMCTLLGKRLQEVGLISKNASSQQLVKSAYEFCPHHVSHFLGMDVHDTSLVSRGAKVQPGMVITLEPGIYINEKMNVPREFKGLGIRIEDDILITENGPVVLTEKCVKDVETIEKLISKRSNR